MKACIVRPHHAGLFSLINNVITCLSLYDYVAVDWSQGCIYGNAWPALFSSHCAASPGADEISNYPHQALTYKNAGLLYQAEKLMGWRWRCHVLWRKLLVRPEILRDAAQFHADRLPENFTAVLIRGNGHAGEQITNRAQTFDDYARAIEKQTVGRLFVMSADSESLEWFRGRFDITTHPGTRRSNSRDVQPHLDGPQTPADARQCLTEVLIASRATGLIHPVSNMATAALYMNPALESVFLA